MKALRKLVLGETWALPIGVFLTLGIALALHAAAGSSAWWRHGGGFIVLVLVVATLVAALAPAYRARR
jgi:membrane protein YdbS with pleckstrin-like domain